MKAYILATDFSQNACDALEFAVRYVQDLEGQLILFHAYDAPEPYAEVPYYIHQKLLEEKRQQAVEQLQIWQKTVEKMAPTVSCTYLTQQGPFVEALISIVERDAINGVFMGTKGYSGLKRTLMGSNTISALGNVDCPILAIPKGCTYSGIHKIAYATDFQGDHGDILTQLNHLIGSFDAKIEIIHINTGKHLFNQEMYNWYQEVVTEILPKEKVSFHIIHNKSVQVGISTFVEKHDTDLVVMAMSKKNWLHRMLAGSYTKRQIGHMYKPLLIFHPDVKETTMS